jgi:arylsulfatase A-like enzyme
MVDFFPTLCGLAGVPVPQTVEGTNLASSIVIGEQPRAAAPDSVFLMNFSKYFDWFQNGAEWRGVRTRSHMYCKRLSGEEELYDLRADPLQSNNTTLTDHDQLEKMRVLLEMHQRTRADELVPCTDWQGWLDEQRRVVRNAKGELSHPETPPDWSLL